jgi:hypothetical protein
VTYFTEFYEKPYGSPLFHVGRQSTDGEPQTSGYDEAVLDSALLKRLKIYGRRVIIGKTTSILGETNGLDCQK